MKTIFLILIFAAGTLLAQTNSASGEPGKGPLIATVDGYAARIDNTVITYGDIRENIAPLLQQLVQRYQGKELAEKMDELYVDTRETLIEETLISEEAKARGLALPAAMIDEEVDRLIRERFNGDRARLIRALAARRMTFDEWREEVADQITLRVYYSQEVLRRAAVSTETIRAAYEENKENFAIPFNVKFRAILINKGTTEEDRAVKKQQANDVLKKLTGGADFAETAKEVSEGIRADQGGAFPWSSPGDIRAELRPALYSVATGELSDLIETEEEFYIIKIEERREKGYVPLPDVRAQIEGELLAIEQERLHRELMERLAQRHFVIRY